MRNGDEFERLLGEIPYATSLNPAQSNAHSYSSNLVDNGYDRASGGVRKVNGYDYFQDHGFYDDRFLGYELSEFSLQSDGSSSSSSFHSGGHSLSSTTGWRTPSQFEEMKTHVISGNGFWLDFEKANERSLVDDLNLSKNLGKMYISDEQECASLDCFESRDQSAHSVVRRDFEKYKDSDNYDKSFSDNMLLNQSIPGKPICLDGMAGSKLMEIQNCHGHVNLLRQPYGIDQSGRLFSRSEFVDSSSSPRFDRSDQMGFPLCASSTLCRPLIGDTLFYASQNELSLIEARNPFYSENAVQLERRMPQYNEETLLHFQPMVPNEMNNLPMDVQSPGRSVDASTNEGTLIVQGDEINYAKNKVHVSLRGHPGKGFHHETGAEMPKKTRSHLDVGLPTAVKQACHRNPDMYCPFSMQSKCSSLGEAQGHIYHIAKDQHGCRFLQKVFDEGTSTDLHIIYLEIIDHVVELMMNPFGNYLMQKLLEVCNEEQRLDIVIRVTNKPGELVRISLNTHGTRVVQKLVETIKSKQQIFLVISALEPGFLALIKDLNGNHVVQRCLQCFSNEDSKFIFIAAAKYCIDIAMHQHGCCVLQRCIRHSNGEHRENLVAVIAENGLLLSQDAFGNYVVQFILELKIHSATSKFTSQFEKNYVHLSMQKFSSHVVEKCLELSDDEARTKIIDELLSADPFEQLLQDPHANYVVQKALRVSEGAIRNALVDAIESHKAVSRNSPYSKRIYSHRHLKR